MQRSTTCRLLRAGMPLGVAGLLGTTTRAAVNGVAVFDDLRIDRAGQSYTLVARTSGLVDGETQAFNILP